MAYGSRSGRGSDGVQRFVVEPGACGLTGARKAPLDASDLAFIRARRVQGASWQAIAKMLGRNAETLRQRFEEPAA